MRQNRLAPALLLVFLALAPQPVKAAMMFCNRTHYPVEAAIGYRESTAWVSEGWWRIDAGTCSRVIGGSLTQRFYFYYARSLGPPVAAGKPPLVWSGKYNLCVDNKAFRIQGDEDCKTRKFNTFGFQEVDIGSNTRDYTLDYKDEDGH